MDIKSNLYVLDYEKNIFETYNRRDICKNFDPLRLKYTLCREKRSDRLSLSRSKQINAKESQMVVLNCDQQSSWRNDLIIEWRHNGKNIRQAKLNAFSDIADSNAFDTSIHRTDERIFISRKNGSLIILSTLPNDAGVYECYTHENSATSTAKHSYELNIIEELRFSPQPTSKQLELGSPGKLHCKAQGTPIPTIHWIKVTFILTTAGGTQVY